MESVFHTPRSKKKECGGGDVPDPRHLPQVCGSTLSVMLNQGQKHTMRVTGKRRLAFSVNFLSFRFSVFSNVRFRAFSVISNVRFRVLLRKIARDYLSSRLCQLSYTVRS